jgi:hypothetical protein
MKSNESLYCHQFSFVLIWILFYVVYRIVASVAIIIGHLFTGKLCK